MNTFGRTYQVMLSGSSHGNLVGVTIEGIPAGIAISIDEINSELKKRRPGQSRITTARNETDEVIIETGLFNGKTTGQPLTALVRNEDVESGYYETIKHTPRPGHADYPAFVKYKGMNDYRGGGSFSGRMTIGIIIAGTIARQLMADIEIHAYTQQIGSIIANPKNVDLKDETIYSNNVHTADTTIATEMEQFISNIKKEGDSVGGVIQCVIHNLPVGVGEPWFDSLESALAHVVFSIPAVKGIEFGSGFQAARMLGSEHNDIFVEVNGQIKTLTNNAGGILGGLSNGMPITFRVVFKPTSSISKRQNTINLLTKEITELKIKGRHDPCIVPRAVPVVTHAANMVIYDLLRTGGFL